MINYTIQRNHIEGLILSCLLNQHRTLDLDKIEFEAYKLPFKLFKANYTHRMVAKAIYNLQCEGIPVDDVIVHDYISKKTKLNEEEYLQLHCYTWCSYETMLAYVKMLKDLDEEESRLNLLKAF